MVGEVGGRTSAAVHRSAPEYSATPLWYRSEREGRRSPFALAFANRSAFTSCFAFGCVGRSPRTTCAFRAILRSRFRERSSPQSSRIDARRTAIGLTTMSVPTNPVSERPAKVKSTRHSTR